MEAIAGIDIAVWDVKAQALGIPLYLLAPKSRSPEALLAVSQLRTTQSKFPGRPVGPVALSHCADYNYGPKPGRKSRSG
jgi:L-alanine-DL-glutamate epimerase-like enolase superfamily enzyme